tara:strand:+ start:900 stop:1178 length:279 start_codon:yes stop_codon:yes gene_type:complete
MISALSPAHNGAHPKASTDQQKLAQAAQAFEAIFVRNMIGAMRQSSLGDDLMGNGGGDQFRDMMDDHIADEMTQNNGLGIADLLIAQWKDKL